MRVGITEDDANSAVSSLVKWAAFIVELINSLREFLSALGIGNDSSSDAEDTPQKK